ncbi:MAG: hypothetical protein WB773_09160, partial [Isosphaeraceae bacterium]
VPGRERRTQRLRAGHQSGHDDSGDHPPDLIYTSQDRRSTGHALVAARIATSTITHAQQILYLGRRTPICTACTTAHRKHPKP